MISYKGALEEKVSLCKFERQSCHAHNVENKFTKYPHPHPNLII